MSPSPANKTNSSRDEEWLNDNTVEPRREDRLELVSLDSRAKATVKGKSIYVGDQYMKDESVIEVVQIISGYPSLRFLLQHRVSGELYTTTLCPREHLREEDRTHYIDMEIYLPPNRLPFYVCRPIAGPLYKEGADDAHQITMVRPHSDRILDDIEKYN